MYRHGCSGARAAVVGGCFWLLTGLLVAVPLIPTHPLASLRYYSARFCLLVALACIGVALWEARRFALQWGVRGTITTVTTGVWGGLLGVASSAAGVLIDRARVWVWVGARVDLAAFLFAFGLFNVCVGLMLVGYAALGEQRRSSPMALPLLIGCFGLLTLLVVRLMDLPTVLFCWMFFGVLWVWVGLIAVRLLGTVPAGVVRRS